MTLTRPSLCEPEPPHSESDVEPHVSFCHPGYHDSSNEVFSLPARDNGGIHYGTALTFCGIIAGNTFHTGFFAKLRDGEREPDDWNSILFSSKFYFFALEDRTSKYPISTSFADWRFPAPENLPPAWQRYRIPRGPDKKPLPTLQTQLARRDGSCRLTSHKDACEAAHLVPKAEEEWFIINNMKKYVSPGNPEANSHWRNAILLRRDLHHMLDTRRWAPLLKEGRLVACTCFTVGTTVSAQFCLLYQNLELQPLLDVSKECLFARVAVAVFPPVRGFVQTRKNDNRSTTAVLNQDGTAEELSSVQMEAKFATLPRGQSASRRSSPGKSPPKRPRADDDAYNDADSHARADADEPGNHGHSCWYLSSSFDSAYDEGSDTEYSGGQPSGTEDDPPRGRKRHRNYEVSDERAQQNSKGLDRLIDSLSYDRLLAKRVKIKGG